MATETGSPASTGTDSNATTTQPGAVLAQATTPTTPVASPVAINGAAVTGIGPPTQGTTVDGKPMATLPLHSDGDISISREQTARVTQNGLALTQDQVVISTRSADDRVSIDQRADGTLEVDVNGKKYDVTLVPGQELSVRTGDGRDVVQATERVTAVMDVRGGNGDDTITTGNGRDRVDGGAGDDTITTRGGRDFAFGDVGNDTIDLGDGNDVAIGGDGNDTIRGGAGDDFLEGARGNDILEAGQGNDIVSGGRGDDTLRGQEGDDRVYTGEGADKVENTSGNDVVYGQSKEDQITASQGASNRTAEVDMSQNVGSSVTVSGSNAFQQQADAIMDFYRSSPNGRQMLAELDRAADPTLGTGRSVTLLEMQNERNAFAAPNGPNVSFQQDNAGNTIVDANGKPTPGTGENTRVLLNPSFSSEAFPNPALNGFHEFSHAYNMVNGHMQNGTYSSTDPLDPDNNGRVPNAEPQVVGLPSSTSVPYDFDRNPATPPTTSNPAELTENGMRDEMGLPQRPKYNVPNPFAMNGTPPDSSYAMNGFSMDPDVARMLTALQSGDPQALKSAVSANYDSAAGAFMERGRIESAQQQITTQAPAQIPAQEPLEIERSGRGPRM
jgi:Ca2+-binding RTX toxin-like protein